EKDAADAARAAADAARAARDEAAAAAEAADAGDEQKQALSEAEAALETADAAKEAAEQALAAKREAFDLVAVFTAVAAGRPGTGVADSGASGDELKTVIELESVEPVAPWSGAAAVAALTEEHPLSTQVQRSKPAIFQLRLLDARIDPVKPLADIRDTARAEYFTTKAAKVAEERAEAFEETLLELAKEKAADKIAELEAERATTVQER